MSFVLDPMMATAATISATVSILKQWGATKIIVVCVLASKPGLAKVGSCVVRREQQERKKNANQRCPGGRLAKVE